MQVIEHETLEQLRVELKKRSQVREHRRLRAVVLAREGQTAPQIARTLGCARRPVQRWVERYNKGGAAALAEGKRSGRPARLGSELEPAFRKRLEAGPTDTDGGICAFHGQDVRRILKAEFKVLLTLSAVYELLHRLGYSRLCPRPRHPDADLLAQAAFKKTRPIG